MLKNINLMHFIKLAKMKAKINVIKLIKIAYILYLCRDF